MPSDRFELDGTSVGVVYGTRPEMIKLAPLLRLLGQSARVLHTGQHYDDELDTDIAADLGLPAPAVRIDVGGQSRAVQVGEGLTQLAEYVESLDALIVQGDTNSALAGALAANATETMLFHVEAGLRSFDRRMPEEHNRVLVDHLSDVCWVPTDVNQTNLRAEGISDERIELTGNPIVESLESFVPSEPERAKRRMSLDLPEDAYLVSTLHRPENVDDPHRLSGWLETLASLPLPVVFPLHPRTRATVEEHGLDLLLRELIVCPPLSYRDFLSVLADSHLAISDSGGIQEEVSILKVPLIVVRRSTERPEVMGTFATLVESPGRLFVEATSVLDQGESHATALSRIPSPYGDGSASQRMFDSLGRALAKQR